MRQALLYCLLLLLTGCSLLPPRHDPNQAWVELGQHLQAVGVDGLAVDTEDYFQMPPGRHLLQVRLLFEVTAENVGGNARNLPRTCLLALDYGEFAAGQRYRIEAGSRGFRPWARLLDAHGRPLAKAREGRCGAV